MYFIHLIYVSLPLGACSWLRPPHLEQCLTHSRCSVSTMNEWKQTYNITASLYKNGTVLYNVLQFIVPYPHPRGHIFLFHLQNTLLFSHHSLPPSSPSLPCKPTTARWSPATRWCHRLSAPCPSSPSLATVLSLIMYHSLNSPSLLEKAHPWLNPTSCLAAFLVPLLRNIPEWDQWSRLMWTSWS